MSIFTNVIRCGICGEPLTGAGNPYICAICGNTSYTTNPILEDELRTANAMRECTRFDEALLMYKQIVKKYKNDDLSEVYWNLLLCEQHVMFETDEKGERFPSFYAVVSDDVEDSPYYTCAVAAAEKHAPERVRIFTEMAEKMVRAKQLYSRIRESAKPYDIFICFKKSRLDGSGTTPDTDLAIDLYNHFAKDYNIFFSERSLRDVAVRDFEPNIYYALYTAKVMLVLCSKREYIDSQWVHNEWSRYHAFAQNPAAGKTIIPIFLEDFQPGSLPTELLSYQGLVDNRHLFDDLDNTLRKILKPLDVEATLNARLSEQSDMWQKMMEEQRRQNEEQQRRMQEQLDAMMKAQMNKPSVVTTPPTQTPASAAPKPAPAPKSTPAPKPDFEIVGGVLKKYTGRAADIKIPEGVTHIGDKAFWYRHPIKSIVLPEGVKSIGEDAFALSDSITSITLPKSLMSIADTAFRGCNSLQSINLPEGIKSLGKSIFESCSALENVKIPGSVTDIGKMAFSGCSSLKSISLSEEIRSIGEHAFARCTSLENIAIPRSVTSIERGVFDGCESLESILLPNSITGIGEAAFSGCRSLKSIKIPKRVKGIGSFAFSGCSALASVEIPNTAERIEKRCFSYCKALEFVIIPDSVISIGEKLFEACDSLREVVCPMHLEEQVRANLESVALHKVKVTLSSAQNFAIEKQQQWECAFCYAPIVSYSRPSKCPRCHATDSFNGPYEKITHVPVKRPLVQAPPVEASKPAPVSNSIPASQPAAKPAPKTSAGKVTVCLKHSASPFSPANGSTYVVKFGHSKSIKLVAASKNVVQELELPVGMHTVSVAVHGYDDTFCQKKPTWVANSQSVMIEKEKNTTIEICPGKFLNNPKIKIQQS